MLKRFVFLISIFVLLFSLQYVGSAIASSAPEIEWEKILGGSLADGARSIQQTSDDGYISVGWTYSYGAGGIDIYLVKTNSFGNMEWEKTFGGSSDDIGTSVQQTTDGGYIVSGTRKSNGYDDAYILKTNSSGDVEWERFFGGRYEDGASDVRQTIDGGYIVAGYTWSYSVGNNDAHLIKLDSLGNTQWEKIFGGFDYDWASSVRQTPEGGYIVAGGTNTYGAGWSDIYLLKIDAFGNKEWDKTFGSTNAETASSIELTKDGGYAISGGTTSFGAGGWDVYLIKTDFTGNMLWEKTFGSPSSDYGWSLSPTNDGGFTIIGSTWQFGSSDVYALKTNGEGVLEWEKSIDKSGYDMGWSIKETKDGGYVIAGETGLAGGAFYLIKLKSMSIVPLIFDVDPDTLNERSKGQFITAYIELPTEFDIASINIDSIRLNNLLPIDTTGPISFGDYNNNGISDIMVKFNRAAVQNMVAPGNVDLTITANLISGATIKGTDTIHVIEEGVVHTDEPNPASIQH